MADLSFQGISSDSNRTARIWQRPMRSPTSHARIAIFSAESPILAKTIAEEIGRIADRDLPFAKTLEQVQAACAQISDGEVGLLIGESDGDTLTFHAHGPLQCFLAEPNGVGGFNVTALPVETYSPTEAFTYVTGQVGNGIFVAFTTPTGSLTNPEVVAHAALSEDGLWQLKKEIDGQEAEESFCIVVGKSGRAIPGAVVLSEDSSMSEVFNAAASEAEKSEDIFAPAASIAEAIDGMQSWAKDTRSQFEQSVKKASTFDPRSFFRKMGNAFVAGKSGSVGASVTGERSSPFKNFSRNALNRFMRMPRNLQIASAGLLVCLVLFLVGLGIAPLLGYGTGNTKTDQELIAISSLIDDAQSNLIYKNEDRAVTLVKEADTRLKALSADTPLIKNKEITRRKNELESRITTMRTDLRHAVSVATDKVLISEAVGINALGVLGSNLYALRDTEVIRWNASENLFETVATLPSKGTSLIADDQDQVLVSKNENNSLSLVNAKTKKVTSGPTTPQTINIIAAYGGRFYGVDLARGVVRITDTSANPWLKSPVAMTDPRGIAVDGDVYVALANEIKKFRTGNTTPFTLAAIDPSVSDIKALYTTTDSSFLYVLDQGGNRLLAINKNGKLARQYELPQGQTAQSMGISEGGKTAYLLIGTNIVAVPLTHL